MGYIVGVKCNNCGFEKHDIQVGYGMNNQLQAPKGYLLGCLNCKTIFESKRLRNNCLKCGESTIEYYFRIGLEDVKYDEDEPEVFNKSYKCPACRQTTLAFAHEGFWD